MKKILPLFSILIFLSCNSDDSGKKITFNNSSKNTVIKYPLPSSNDSLFSLLKNVGDDSNKINILNALGRGFVNNNPDTAIILGNQALVIAENLSNSQDSIQAKTGKTDVANSYGNLGIYYRHLGNYQKALNYFFKSMALHKDLRNQIGIEGSLGNIGLVYNDMGDYPKALDFNLQALAIGEKLDDKNKITIRLGNIAIIYSDLKDFKKALDYNFRALAIRKELGATKLLPPVLSNIGTVYDDIAFNARTQNDTATANADFSKALDYYFQALKIDEDLGNKNGIGNRLGNIGNVYVHLAENQVSKIKMDSIVKKALSYYFNGLKIRQEIHSKKLTASILTNISVVYLNHPNMPPPPGETKTGFTLAAKYLYQSILINESAALLQDVENDYQTLSDLYEKSTVPLPDSIGGKILNMEQMRLRALHYFKSYVNLRDTLFSQENKKQLVQKEMNYEFDKKETKQKAEQDKKDALANEQLKQKVEQRNYFIAGFALVLILAGFIFRSYRQKQKANEIISKQKLLVEEKQKEILDSIHYAKRIQQSMMPTEKFIDRNLKRLTIKG